MSDKRICVVLKVNKCICTLCFDVSHGDLQIEIRCIVSVIVRVRVVSWRGIEHDGEPGDME